MNRSILLHGIAVVLVALVAVTPRVLMASALSSPAVLVRGFAGQATDTAQLIEIASTTGIKLGPTRSILICNDDDPDEVGGGEDLWCNISGTAADPGSTFTVSSTFVVKAGEKINIDCEANRISIRVNTAGQTANARIIASY